VRDLKNKVNGLRCTVEGLIFVLSIFRVFVIKVFYFNLSTLNREP